MKIENEDNCCCKNCSEREACKKKEPDSFLFNGKPTCFFAVEIVPRNPLPNSLRHTLGDNHQI